MVQLITGDVLRNGFQATMEQLGRTGWRSLDTMTLEDDLWIAGRNSKEPR